jgi:hypothetical protein
MLGTSKSAMSKIYKIIAIPLILLAILLSCESINDSFISQEIKYGSISGNILDEFNNWPICSAKIIILSSSDTVLTDTSGYFSADSITIGKHQIIIQKSGYNTDSSIIEIFENENTIYTHHLAHNSFFIITDSLEYQYGSQVLLYIVNNDTSSVYIWTCSMLYLYCEKFELDHWELVSIPICNGFIAHQTIEFPRDCIIPYHIYSGRSGIYRVYLHYSHEENFNENLEPIKYSNIYKIK